MRRPRKPVRLFDAEGVPVLITMMCRKCHRIRPLDDFGLRRMGNGKIRSIPWCRNCRSKASADRPDRRKVAQEGPRP